MVEFFIGVENFHSQYIEVKNENIQKDTLNYAAGSPSPGALGEEGSGRNAKERLGDSGSIVGSLFLLSLSFLLSCISTSSLRCCLQFL